MILVLKSTNEVTVKSVILIVEKLTSYKIGNLEFHLSLKWFCVFTKPDRVSFFVEVLPEVRDGFSNNIIAVRVAPFEGIQVHCSEGEKSFKLIFVVDELRIKLVN